MQQDENISLLSLVSTCVDACTRGCKVIRFVHNKRKGVNCTQETPSTIGVSYKIADDPRSALTEADLSSQQVIIACLRDVWGDGLNIIGEEDTDEVEQPVADESLFAKYSVPNLSEEKVNIDILHSILNTRGEHLNDMKVSLREVTLYIDPMDGTREFVEGRIRNVQCLIGITIKNKPVGGVIGLPFVSFAAQNEKAVNVVCAIKSEKNCTMVENICLDTPISSSDAWLQIEEETKKESSKQVKASGAILNVFTGDSERVQKKHALDFLEKATKECSKEDDLKVCISGGCGNKMFRATAKACLGADGNAICLIPPGTCSWDTAAPTALMMAAMDKYGKDGKITNFFGGELVYDSTGKKVINDLGAIVSCGKIAVSYHDRLTNAMTEDEVILKSMPRK